MAVCCQNLPLGVLSSSSAPFVLVGALFKKFSLFLNTGVCIRGLTTRDTDRDYPIYIRSDSSPDYRFTPRYRRDICPSELLRSVGWLTTFRESILASSSSVSNTPKRIIFSSKNSSWTYLSLKIWPTRCPTTLATNQPKRRNNPNERRFQ